MQRHYLLGIDGGGTHCRSRLTDLAGNTLAACQSGSANVYSDFTQATATVERLIADTFAQAGLPAQARQKTQIVAGLAGANVPSVAIELAKWQPAGLSVHCCTDVEIACMGAHQGEPGAVLILGTGSQGAAWNGERFTLLGGWGFMLSDHGSGAELGQRALRLALLAHEGVVPASALTRALMATFDDNPETLLLWSRQATPANWARFSPLIFEAAAKQDSAALQLIAVSAQDVGLLIDKLTAFSLGPVALMGGMVAPLTPWLAASHRQHLQQAREDALSGALRLARQLTAV